MRFPAARALLSLGRSEARRPRPAAGGGRSVRRGKAGPGPGAGAAGPLGEAGPGAALQGRSPRPGPAGLFRRGRAGRAGVASRVSRCAAASRWGRGSYASAPLAAPARAPPRALAVLPRPCSWGVFVGRSGAALRAPPERLGAQGPGAAPLPPSPSLADCDTLHPGFVRAVLLLVGTLGWAGLGWAGGAGRGLVKTSGRPWQTGCLLLLLSGVLVLILRPKAGPWTACVAP